MSENHPFYLKPCPFCGCKELEFCRINEFACWVRCDTCGADSPSAAYRSRAIEIWNRRPAVEGNAAFVTDDEQD